MNPQVPLTWLIAAHVETSDLSNESCSCGWFDPEETYVEHLSRVLTTAYPVLEEMK